MALELTCMSGYRRLKIELICSGATVRFSQTSHFCAIEQIRARQSLRACNVGSRALQYIILSRDT